MADVAICPICKSSLEAPARSEQRPSGDKHSFNCPRCGNYTISGTALDALPHLLDKPEKIALLSHAVRKMQGGKALPFLDSYLMDRVLQTEFPNLSDQMKYLVSWLGDHLDPGKKFTSRIEILQTIMGAKTTEGAEFVLEHMNSTGLVDLYGVPDHTQLRLTLAGWESYDSIKRGSAMSRKVFMAMKFGDIDLDSVF